MKKKRKYTKKQTFLMYGNNGGDYIKLKEYKKDLLLLEIGNCCVITYQHIIPVEFLTNVLTVAGLKAAKTIDNDIAKELLKQNCDHDNKYTQKLLDKISLADWQGKPIKQG